MPALGGRLMDAARGPEKGDRKSADAFDGAGDFRPGDLIAGTDYVVRKFLGEGGHASAYECENRIGKRVAVKVMHRHLASRADLVERMVVEAKRTVKLRHRNIVEVHNAGMTTGDRPRAFIEMELLNGSNGRQLLMLKERLEVPHALDVLIDICHALDAAHRAGVVHQDLKPDNIFIHLDEWNGKAVTKLLDFGVARMLGQGHEGTFEGTLVYAAPEQLRGESIVPATDLYALGVIAFELITGRRPFDTAEARDDKDRSAEALSIGAGFFEPSQFTKNLVDAILTEPPPRLCDYIRLPRTLEDLVLQLLEKDAGKRPESAKAVANALQAIRQSPSLPKSVVTTQEILLFAANAQKVPLPREATLRLEPVNMTAEEYAATVPDAPLMGDGALGPGAEEPLRPPEVAAIVRTPPPNGGARAEPYLATERLPSAPGLVEVRIEPHVVAAGRVPPSEGIVPTLEPVTDRHGQGESAASELDSRRRKARRLVASLVGVAAVVLLAAVGVSFRERETASSARGGSSTTSAPVATVPPPPAETPSPVLSAAPPAPPPSSTGPILPDVAPAASLTAGALLPESAAAAEKKPAPKSHRPPPKSAPIAAPPSPSATERARPGPGF